MMSRAFTLGLAIVASSLFAVAPSASACWFHHCRCHQQAYGASSYQTYYPQAYAAPQTGEARFTVDDIGRIIDLLRQRRDQSGNSESPPSSSSEVRDIAARVEQLKQQVDRHEIDIRDIVRSQGEIANALEERFGKGGSGGGSNVPTADEIARLVSEKLQQQRVDIEANIETRLQRWSEDRFEPRKDKRTLKDADESPSKTSDLARLEKELHELIAKEWKLAGERSKSDSKRKEWETVRTALHEKMEQIKAYKMR